MRIPDLTNFMKNGLNKENMLESIEKVIVEERHSLGDRIVYFARGDKCSKISKNGVSNVSSLNTDHVEADTKICYLAQHAASNCRNGNDTVCVVRSASGDIDIPIILLGIIPSENINVFNDSGTGKSRRELNVSRSDLSALERRAIVGFHAFTGNDFNSAFFYKGKVKL